MTSTVKFLKDWRKKLRKTLEDGPEALGHGNPTKSVYKFNAIAIKISASFFTEVEKIIFKIHMEQKYLT